MKHIFQAEGRSLEISGSRWHILDDKNRVFLVDADKVEIFLVRLKGDQPVGPRIHFATAERGEILFGVGHQEIGTDMGLIAVGPPGSRLTELDRSRLFESARDDAAVADLESLLSGWTGKWADQLDGGYQPKTSPVIIGGEADELAAGAWVRTAGELIWVRHVEGCSRYMGRKNWELTASGLYLPLSKKCWLEITDASTLEIPDLKAGAASDFLLSGLDDFHKKALPELESDIARNIQGECLELDAKKQNDRRIMETALHQFADIMGQGRKAPRSAGAETDAFAAACKLVGGASGIEVTVPGRELQKGRDPLDAIARASRFRFRSVMLKESWHRTDGGPLLATLEKEKTPVALLPLSPGRYLMHDPATGKRTKVTAAVSETLGPSAWQFYRPFPERLLKGYEIFKIGLEDCRGDLTTVILMGLFGALLGLLTPVTMGIVFDTVIPGADRNQLFRIAIILLTCAFATAMFEFTKAIALMRVEGKMDASVQAGVMDRLLSLPVPFFRNYTSGDLADRTMGISAIRQMLSGITLQTLLSAVFSTVYLVLLFWYDWKLSLLAIALSIAGILFTLAAGYFQIQYQKKMSTVQGTISGKVFQFINGIGKLRVSGAENRAFAVWAGEFTHLKKLAYKAGTVGNILATFNAVFPILTSMAIFGWIIWSEMESFSTGSFLAFNSAFTNFQGSLLQMSSALMGILNIVPLYERAKPILETLPEVDEAKAAPDELAGRIEVNHACFRYEADGPLIISDVSLAIRPGQFIALVGSSGSGKSTMLRLLLGFETPESGSIYYDGQDLASLDVREVRRQTGVVLQNGVLMAGDIFKNIVGSSRLTIDDAWEAARMAGLENDIKEMPMGMHTVLPPGGGTLSGGQRQRLLIARAIVNKPRILFFDEATSALDNQAQALVSQSLESLQATRIVIAHRLSTIVNADAIFVLDKGQVVQSGTYDELISQSGPFADMAKRQIA